MSEDNNKKLFNKYYSEAMNNKRVNDQSLDKNLLTLSITVLGFFVAYVKYAGVEIERTLLWSASCLLATVAMTVFSFLIGNVAIDSAVERARRYYIDNDDSAYGESSFVEKIGLWLHWIIPFVFFAGMSLGLFSIYNHNKQIFNKGENFMKETKKRIIKNNSTGTIVKNSVQPPNMIIKENVKKNF